MTSRKGDLIAFLVLSAASGLLILFYGAREVAGWESHRLVQAAAALWLVPALLAVLRRKRGGGSLATNLQLALASCLLSALLLEAAFRALPDLFPENLRRLARDHQFTGADRLRVVEHLPYNPFEKLKADTTVHVPGYYGPSSHFAYEWSTDRRGFKNSPEIAAAERFDVVVLGDSFVEGMGVATEDTFSSQLTDLGCPAYSLGVEGYAPYQFRGIYEHFARGLRPKLVLVGYLSGISQREAFFLRPEAEIASAGKLPSAIGRLVEEDELSEKHPIVLETAEGYRVPVVPDTRYEFAITALVALARHAAAFQRTFDIRGGVANPDSDVRFMTESALAKVEGVSLRWTPFFGPSRVDVKV